MNLMGREVVGFSYIPPSPWETFREMQEELIWQKLDYSCKHLNNPHSSIFCFHCPPSNTNLDITDKVIKSGKDVMVDRKSGMVHVGSHSIRKIIEKYQPLLSIHGHIHESAGEDMIEGSLCINPGSEYELGILNAAIVTIENSNIDVEWKKI